jgi:hypothetical protein
MIISPSKAEDIRWRTELLTDMAMDLRQGRVITAREIGKVTSWLADRIKNHDYTKDDAIHFMLLHSVHPRATL